MRNIYFIMIISIFVGISFLTLQCTQKSPNQTETTNEIPSKISYEITQVKSLSVPTAVPEKIDSLALLHAAKLNCDGIRMLVAEAEKEESSYLISFFTDDEGIREEALYSLDGEVKILNKKEGKYLNNLLDSGKLPKATDPCDHCWNLAYFFENANYDSINGNFFQFSQQAHNVGYYHKVIYRLGSSANCCRENFPGGLNNLVSSHLWANETKCGKRTVVDKIKVWEDNYRSGASYTFTSTKAYHDNNYSDEDFCVPIPWPPYIDCYTINDRVSSVDMMYYVYNE